MSYGESYPPANSNKRKMIKDSISREWEKHLTRQRVPNNQEFKYMVFDGKIFTVHKRKPRKLYKAILLYRLIRLEPEEILGD